MSDRIKRTLFILMRLYHNQAGNTLAMVAAAIFPLAALVGGGVEMSRIYLTKTRLQQACDAGALAGRRSMSGITWTTTGTGNSKETAEKFFNINFPAHRYGTNSSTVDYNASNTGAVTGVASAVVPMSLMSLFGMPAKTVTVECTADLQLPNTDVMFVLDTTLSMNDINPGDSQSRIAVLRAAVTDFYNTLQSVKPAGSHIRYGFVPYSSTVNVGMLLKRDWIQDVATYDSRVSDGTSIIPGSTQGATITTTTTVTISGSTSTGTKYQGSSEQCTAPANSLSDDYSDWSGWSPSATSLPRSRTRTRTRNGTTYSAGLNNGICWITPTNYNNLVEEQTQTIKENPNAGDQNADGTAYHWIYQRVDYSMADLKGTGDGNATVSGGDLETWVGNNHTRRVVSWKQSNACIEERKTRRSDEGPDESRYDMDVDLIPDKSNRDTQWKPFLPGVVYGRKSGNLAGTTGWVYSESAETKTRDVNINATTNYVTPSSDLTQYGACPTYARKLAEIDSSTLATYLAALKPAGFTYHDIGMLWGLRLMSREGLFAAEHAAAEASGRYARNLIFMTDGQTDTRIGAYDAWGQSAVARRRTPKGSIPTNAEQNAITEARLTELCNIAKNNKNITVWVIAFGTELTSLLSNCASPGRAYQANNASQLTETFSQIASQIAQLRVTR
ncbi:TadE/TadG family type IV pilus assembly protein [Sphingobium sp. DC-2]|uniref:TadE/TadG family type IV pilus assembly protein n=1 Tax=Sphingobium sp. DC-2 TaxID=1303256 RepID=UPI0004C42D22|nr:TadE/TadG family type IV pilus assembly protein [Sphingobium sp. DC-2]